MPAFVPTSSAATRSPLPSASPSKVDVEISDPARTFAALRAEHESGYERGRDRGLNVDLEISIELARIALARARGADERGAALNDVAVSMQALGERESGTDRLEEAVSAYRAALEERTRERVPLDWAKTQTNLGAALATLGERESGTARLEQAVAAYRAALEERTRERVPLDWAKTQINLGNALLTLGERESGTARLEQAVAAYRAALEERTRERVPLDWAMTQNNLGTALQTLGERESGTARLEQAVAAYRAALEERTRERVPLDWATTQNNLGTRAPGPRRTRERHGAAGAGGGGLPRGAGGVDPRAGAARLGEDPENLGTALQALGERESGTARLEEAVAAYRAALEERTRERVPLDWAKTQINLGNALRPSANARAARRGWRRRWRPTARRWRSGPASGCRSTGRWPPATQGSTLRARPHGTSDARWRTAGARPDHPRPEP